MDEHDVIRIIGRFPDKINPSELMKSKAWQCAKCGAVYHFLEETDIPVYPCSCGSIFWLKVTS